MDSCPGGHREGGQGGQRPWWVGEGVREKASRLEGKGEQRADRQSPLLTSSSPFYVAHTKTVSPV